MKTYFRLLSFAKPIEKFAIPYILFTLLYVFFSTMVLVLLGPLLNALFATSSHAAAVVQTGPAPSIFHMPEMFKYYMQYYINNYGGAWGALKFVCFVIVVFVFLGNLFRYLSQRTMENLRVHTLLNLRKTVFNNVMDLHLGYFSNERKGDIISKVASDVQVVQYSVTGTLQVIFKEPVTMIAYMVALFNISAKLTFFSLLVIPVSAFIISRIVKRLKSQAIAGQQSYSNMISYLDEALSGIKIIKAFNALDFIKGRFNQENERYSSISRSMARRQQLASPVSETLSVTMIAFIVLYGGYLILNKQSNLDAGHFIAYIGIFSQLQRPAKAISDSFGNIHSGIAAGERVLALIDEKPMLVDAPNAVAINGFNDGIRFENVTFAYNEKNVLNNISVTIPKGKTVALVGPSGGR